MPETRAVLFEYTGPHAVHYNDEDRPDPDAECFCYRETITLTRHIGESDTVHILTLSDGEPFGAVVSIRVDAAVLSALVEGVNKDA